MTTKAEKSLSVVCPVCRAGAGRPCTRTGPRSRGLPILHPHRERQARGEQSSRRESETTETNRNEGTFEGYGESYGERDYRPRYPNRAVVSRFPHGVTTVLDDGRVVEVRETRPGEAVVTVTSPDEKNKVEWVVPAYDKDNGGWKFAEEGER